MLKAILAVIFLASCSSMSARDWGPWQHCGVAHEKEDWRFCDASLDGEKHHKNGVCYKDLECRYRKTIFGNTRKEERTVMKFCDWRDLESFNECMDRNKVWPKVIKNKE